MSDSGISYFKIEDTKGDYFWTARQIQRIKSPYVDEYPASSVGSSAVSILSNPPNRSRAAPQTQRDYLVSGSFDERRTGAEISTFHHWAAGQVKISAGTPGHIVRPVCFGVEAVSSVDADKYFELAVFNPVEFLTTPAAEFTYPIAVSETNITPNYELNGVLEPLSIRSVASFFSIDVPREARAIRGSYDGGNEDHTGATDQVVNVDYADKRSQQTSTFFLEAGTSLSVLSGSRMVGAHIPYFNLNVNNYRPFEDAIRPRGLSPSATYVPEMIDVLMLMSSSRTDTYIAENQRSATTGFVYDNTNPQGTDSIAFGGMLY